MRIVMVLANAFYPDPRVQKEAQSLSSIGHEVVVLAWDRRGQLPINERLACGALVKRYRGAAAYGRGLVQITSFGRFWLWAIRNSRRLGASIVHCHDLDTAPVGLALVLGGQIRFTYDAHEPSYARRPIATDSWLSRCGKWLSSAAIGALERLVVRTATTTIVTTPLHAGKYLSWGARHIVEVANYPQVSLDAVVTDRANSASVVTFGTVGVVRPHTGLDMLIDAARLVWDRGRTDIRVEVSGYSTLSAYERMLRSRAGRLQNVTFDIANAPERLAERLSRLDVVCVLYDPEIENYRLNVATRLFDAMAVGRPALVTDAGYSAYLVRMLGCGFVLIEYSANALADLMCSIADERESLPELGRQARAASLVHYNWTRSEAMLSTIYPG